MTSPWIAYLCLGTGLTAAMVGGVFLAFSDFIMRALNAANPVGSIESMQEINITVLRSIFLTSFFLLVPASFALSAYALFRLDGVAVALILAGSMVYLVAVFLMTIAGNVPMNNMLARMEPNTPESIAYWRIYGRRWTRLNHLRSAGSLICSATFLLAAMALA